MIKSSREYFMTYDAPDLASELETYHKRYVSASHNPVYKMWIRNIFAYYSTVFDTQTWLSALNFTGEQGELVKMSIPQARGLLRQLLTLITKQRLAFNAIAETTGTDVTEEKRIANALCSQTVEQQDLDVKLEHLVEEALVVGCSFIYTRWRTDRGAPRAIQEHENGKKGVIYDGDLDISIHDVFDVTFDFMESRWEELKWVEVRTRHSRWDLIAQHPELEEHILRLPSCNKDTRTSTALDYDDKDMVYVFEMYHKPTPALPRGRMMMYSDKKTIYHDGINEYNAIPIEQLKPERISGMGFGYPMLSNLLPSQEMYDHSYSCIATNQSSLGVINIANPRGSEVNVQQLNGMNFFDYTPQQVPGGGKPENIDLLKSAPELFKFPEMLLSNMQSLSYINPAIRGEIPGGTSGVAIATMTTNALEFLNSYMKSTRTVLEKTMFHAINAYRTFAKNTLMVRITGQNYQTFSKKFTGDQLAPIKSIKIDAVNPLMQTIAGRIDIAEKTLEKGLVKDLQGYVSILDGEPISNLTRVETSENDLIQSENEMLQAGEDVHALSIDKHPLHIMRHKTLVNDPKIRMNSASVAKIMAHIEEHNQLEKTTDPMLMAMANTGTVPEGMPMPQQQPMAGPPGAQPPPELMAPPPMAPGEDQQTSGRMSPTAQGVAGLNIKQAKPAARGAPDALGRQ